MITRGTSLGNGRPELISKYCIYVLKYHTESPCLCTIAMLTSIYNFLGGTVVWTQSFTLAKQALLCMSNASNPVKNLKLLYIFT
jgi:hypothetical protein